MTKSRKRAVYGSVAVVALALVGWGASAYLGKPASIPDSRLATVERGTIARSVVATGKIEPITKVEIKSKANGIIKLLPVEVDQQVEPGTVLVELDRENLMARGAGSASHVAGRASGTAGRRSPAREKSSRS